MATEEPDENCRTITQEDRHPFVRRAYGGYWDKLGNRFEVRWALHQLVLMTESTSDIESLEREPVGENEKGVDLWVNRRGGRRECHQCKRAKEGRASWSMRELHREGILGHLKFQLERDPSKHLYRLISGTPALDFESLLREARDSRDAETFWRHQVLPFRRLSSAFNDLCRYLEVETDHREDRQRVWRLLRGSDFIPFHDNEHSRASLEALLGSRLKGDVKIALALLETWLGEKLRCPINLESVSAHLLDRGFRLIQSETDRFHVAGTDLAQKRVNQGKLPAFEAELAELTSQAATMGRERLMVLGDRWILIEEIRRGGIAEVWLGKDRNTKEGLATRLYAIKLLRADRAHDQVLLQRFVQGAERIKAIANLHPAITSVLDGPFNTDHRHYYTMEYVGARDLESWTRERRVPFAEGDSIVEEAEPSFGEALWRIFCTVADGLSALHTENLVHGDVKPSNILVKDDGEVKLIDFDLVQPESHQESQADIIGTMPFLAPELRERRATTAKSDQYSFAATLLDVLSGGRLTQGETVAKVLSSLEYTPALRKCLEIALSLDPRVRYPKIEELMSSLGPEAFRRSVRGPRLTVRTL